MTAQISETLLYVGDAVAMDTEPLEDYFAMGGLKPEFKSNCSALWRGYIGQWDIVAGRLYLVGLSGMLADGTQASLATVFPGYPKRVFAHWYSGTIRLPKGKRLNDVHIGYCSTTECDHFLDVVRGVIRKTRVGYNETAVSADATESHGLAAKTEFLKDIKDGGECP